MAHPASNKTKALREKFSHGVAMGLSATEAAKQAGYGPRFAMAKAAALARHPSITARVADLRGEAEYQKPTLPPALAGMTIPEARLMVAREAYEIAQDAKLARDRRAALQGLSLMSDVLGLKAATMRLEMDPLGDTTRATLLMMLRVIEGKEPIKIAADGSHYIEVEAEDGELVDAPAEGPEEVDLGGPLA